MAFFFKQNSSLSYCSILFTTNSDGSYNGIMFGLTERSHSLIRAIPPISFTLGAFACAELISIVAQLFYELQHPYAWLARIDLATTSMTMILLGTVGIIQLYMQKEAIRTSQYYFFNHPKSTLEINWKTSIAFYWIWVSSSLICVITIIRWHYLDEIKANLTETVLLIILIAIFGIACKRVKWLWDKRLDRIISWAEN